MRLDKFLSETGTATRSESKKAARSGGVTLNGIAVRDLSVHMDPQTDRVTYMGSPVIYQKNIYIMMNKPDGVISATDDGNETTVLDLLPEKYKKMEIFPCGRLDKNTLGLLILTNNGALAHRLLSPKCHVEKTYRFECERPLTEADVELLCKGVDIGEKSSTQPAKVLLTSSRSGEISVTEGKFHQIKRMFQAVCNKITYLERIRFADIPLDTALARGEWRELTEEEREILEKH
ncbi:MAG: rRNA pseudouridine synthase [Ruminococcaceae bacterium]|nr:rRNA pseudouridine synthase [Oscillospiraceae bacterium]